MSGGWVFHQFGKFQWALTFIQRKGFILTCSKVHRWCFDLCCQSTAMAGRETQHVRVKNQSLTLCRSLTAISSIHDSRRWSDVAAKMIYLCASNVARKRGAGWSSSWSTARTTATVQACYPYVTTCKGIAFQQTHANTTTQRTQSIQLLCGAAGTAKQI